MSLVQFVNNQEPYLNDENLNNNFNYLDEKISNSLQCIKATMSSNYTINADRTIEILPLDTEIFTKGEGLTVTDNGVKIGAGVNWVLISGAVYWYQNVSGHETITYIYKNEASQIAHNQKMNDNYEQASLPMSIVPVTEGDVITLRTQVQLSSSSATKPTIVSYGTGTFLTVVGFE